MKFSDFVLIIAWVYLGITIYHNKFVEPMEKRIKILEELQAQPTVVQTP